MTRARDQIDAKDRIEAALTLLRASYREPPADDELTADALECAAARRLAKTHKLTEQD